MAEYIFKGNLCGYLCDECSEPLAGVKVRLYRASRDVTQRASADPKDTFELVSTDEIDRKQASLIAEVGTDELGNFVFSLGAKQNYEGEAFEIDVYCGNVPHRIPTRKIPEPIQFSITTIQPQWRESVTGFVEGVTRLVAAFEYCVPARFWCFIRAHFDAWTICGTVKQCDTGAPLGRVKVFAFDRDWLQDDALGSGVTDATGHFRIDYSAAAFKKTIFPFIQLELSGGPDIYFRVENAAGNVILAEPPARGRDNDRNNRGPCFCVELCVPEGVTQDPNNAVSVFDHLGKYNFAPPAPLTSQISTLTGLTNDNYAFFSDVPLRGVLGKHFNGLPLEYMFEVQDITGAGGWIQLALSQMAPCTIGSIETFAPTLTDPFHVVTIPVIINGGITSSAQFVPSVTADGWIQVPQQDNLSTEGIFVPNGNLGTLSTTTLDAWTPVDLTGLSGGQHLLSAQLVQDRLYSIRMSVRGAGSTGPITPAGVCALFAVDNTHYNNENRHPYWGGGLISGQYGVCLLDIQELKTAPCSKITNSLTVMFTAAHPNLGGVSIEMTGPGGPNEFDLPAAASGEQFGTATPHVPTPPPVLPPLWSIGSLSPCAYIVTLTVSILLTNGDEAIGPIQDQIAFCKM